MIQQISFTISENIKICLQTGGSQGKYGGEAEGSEDKEWGTDDGKPYHN